MIAATRPTALRADDNAIELVAWAITALEGAGIYPGLKWISRLIGGHMVQRELEPIVAHFYEQRRIQQLRKSRMQDVNHLDDLYQLVLAHAREEVRKQLAEEFRALHDEADHLERRKLLVENDQAEVARQRALVDEVRRLTTHEMESLRGDQKLLTDRLELSASELATAEARIESLNQSLAASEGTRSRLLAQVERAYAAIQRLTSDSVRLRSLIREGARSRHSLDGQIRSLSAELLRESSQVTELSKRVAGNREHAVECARQAKSAERMCRIEARRADRYRGLSILRQQELKAASTREATVKKMLRIAQREKLKAQKSSAMATKIMRTYK